MIFPTVHINGTHPRSLVDQYDKAVDAISDAIDKLKEIEIHGRDYYPQGTDAISEAIREHEQRIRYLTMVKFELQQVINHLEK